MVKEVKKVKGLSGFAFTGKIPSWLRNMRIVERERLKRQDKGQMGAKG